MGFLRLVRVKLVVGVFVFGMMFTVLWENSVLAETGTAAGAFHHVKDGWNNTPENFSGSDTARINAAVQAASQFGGVVRIGPRKPDEAAKRDYWLLDSAILLPGNTTLYLDNCKLKLSDRCRDNFIRTANCGIGIAKVEPIENVHIIGIGNVELIGADHPRATGDAAKGLNVRSYGTDAGKPNESQTGDWRNIGVLLAHVSRFTLQNITIRQAHCWSVSLERCTYGKVVDLTFDATQERIIDGKKVDSLNQDGLDLRKGSHDITVENIRGRTGDDLVALTAIRAAAVPGGQLDSTEVSQTDPEAMNDIYNVTIRNVVGYSAGGHQIIRFLNASGMKIHHVILDGVIDTSPQEIDDYVTIRIGDANPKWGGVTPLGDTYGFVITNIQSKSKSAIMIAGSLTDSIISNVINYNPEVTGITYKSGIENVRNVQVSHFINAAKR